MKRAVSILLAALLFLVPVFGAGELHVIRHGDEDNKRIALSFDDGPHGEYTVQILDILARYGVKATFFVIGENAAMHPELIRREIEEGHEIGNHTYSHPITKKPSEGLIEKEIGGTERILMEIGGYRPRLFRPPGGCLFDGICGKMNERGYTTVLWSIDTRDWARPGKDKIVSEILSNVKGGSIILCHDYVQKSQTPAALEELLPKLLAEGYEFVTVSELLSDQRKISPSE